MRKAGDRGDSDPSYAEFIRIQAAAAKQPAFPPTTLASWDGRLSSVRDGLRRSFGREPPTPCATRTGNPGRSDQGWICHRAPDISEPSGCSRDGKPVPARTRNWTFVRASCPCMGTGPGLASTLMSKHAVLDWPNLATLFFASTRSAPVNARSSRARAPITAPLWVHHSGRSAPLCSACRSTTIAELSITWFRVPKSTRASWRSPAHRAAVTRRFMPARLMTDYRRWCRSAGSGPTTLTSRRHVACARSTSVGPSMPQPAICSRWSPPARSWSSTPRAMPSSSASPRPPRVLPTHEVGFG